MEPLASPIPATTPDTVALRAQLTRWMSTAETRLRVGGEWPVAGALREGMALVAAELRVGAEPWEEAREGGRLGDARVARLRGLLDRVPVALLVTGADGRVCEANAEALRLVPRAGGLTGRLLVRVVALEDRVAFRALLRDLASGAADLRELPLRLSRGDGRRLDVVATVRACADDGPDRMLYWALREDRRAADEDLLL
jgi:PAS domain-containing protein